MRSEEEEATGEGGVRAHRLLLLGLFGLRIRSPALPTVAAVPLASVFVLVETHRAAGAFGGANQIDVEALLGGVSYREQARLWNLKCWGKAGEGLNAYLERSSCEQYIRTCIPPSPLMSSRPQK